MNTKEQGMELIKYFEGCELKAYKDVVGVWTIGIGNTFYENGDKVKEGDEISMGRAISLLSNSLKSLEERVNSLLKNKLKQNQFDALISLVYNIGSGNFAKSTLLKKVNTNPNDPTIGQEFTKWCKAGGKVVNGLLKRRKVEAHLYLNNELKFDV